MANDEIGEGLKKLKEEIPYLNPKLVQKAISLV
jgi:hypothetical protein